MNKHFNPYFTIDETIYFTDRVEEVSIYKANQSKLAQEISTLLNEAYNAAYQDGLSASLNDHNKELIQKTMMLTIENSRLKKQLNIKEK